MTHKSLWVCACCHNQIPKVYLRSMRAAMTQLNLFARAYQRILKLPQTIADLAGSEEIQSAHLAEALQYRPKLMMG